MKKIIFVLTVFVLIASGCVQPPKKQAMEKSQNKTMPSQKYVGTWYTDDNPPDELTIFEINNTIKFELSIFRIVSAAGTATIEDNKIVFSTDFDFSGTLIFNENSIFVTVDKSDFQYIPAGKTYNFTVK